MKYYRFIVKAFFFLLIHNISSAQPIQINSYKNYDTKKGLVSLNIRKIIQDKYGFIWCATQDGLSRFDGKSFVNFSANTVDGRFLLKGADVFDLLIDETGDVLWALTTYGGLNRISISKCQVTERYNLQIASNTPVDYWYKCMKLDNGFIYVGTDQGVLLKFSTQQKKVIASYSLAETAKIKGPIEELLVNKNQVWLFSSAKGIVVIDTGLLKQTAFIDSEIGRAHV